MADGSDPYDVLTQPLAPSAPPTAPPTTLAEQLDPYDILTKPLIADPGASVSGYVAAGGRPTWSDVGHGLVAGTHQAGATIAGAIASTSDAPEEAYWRNIAQHQTQAASESERAMTPAAQAQSARWDHNYPLAINLLTPLADAGDVRSQLSLADMYSFSTTGFSTKYTPVPDAKVVEVMKKAFPHWSRVDPPENLPLAFKNYQLAAEKGNIWGQWGLGRVYACGFGAEKNLVLAYMWLSLGLAQRGVTTEMTGVSLPMAGSQKNYGLDRDYIAARMKPEEIDVAKQLLTQCLNSKYKDCHQPN